jgi:hypothetical protein
MALICCLIVPLPLENDASGNMFTAMSSRHHAGGVLGAKNF